MAAPKTGTALDVQNSNVSSPLTRGRLLARNSILNLIGQGVPLLIAVFTMPLLVKALGADRFGILALVWVVIGYFSLFDIGLSRATTKYVAETLGSGTPEKLPEVVCTSLVLNLLLGCIAGTVLFMLTPLLVDRVLTIPASAINEARSIFRILALSIPVILESMVLRGVLEGGQRFDLINSVQIVAGSLSFILPLFGVSVGLGLPGIAVLLIAARVVVAVVFLTLCFKVFPILKTRFIVSPHLIRPLFSFGGWMTVSNVSGPILLYLDRFIIGSVISMAAVAYYAAPYEIVIRLTIFPTSMMLVLFPAFSALSVGSKDNIARLYTRSMKYLLIIMGPIVMLVILFAKEILQVWLGAEYALHGTLVFQILAAGILLTPAQVSLSLIQGSGRPDITAKFYLFELIIYIPLILLFVKEFGLPGAAAAWSIRVALDTALLLAAAGKLFDMRIRNMIEHGLMRGIIVLGILAATCLAMLLSGWHVAVKAVAAAGCILVFAAVSWFYVMDSWDRKILSFGRTR
jgi:O-antigen/teichoic acid export membrane protein